MDNTATLLDIALLRAQMAHTELIRLHGSSTSNRKVRRECRAKFVEFRKWTKESERLKKVLTYKK